MSDKKQHWETIYHTKEPHEVSWTQAYPTTAITYISDLNLPLDAAIIDIGGGDSNLVDALLEKGFTNIWVLDISATALERAKNRLGANAELVHWIVSDITEFKPSVQFDFWHDRAVFHFLTTEEDINKYIAIAHHALNENGQTLLGTFSNNGPLKCSGLEIKQYSETAMKTTFIKDFEVVKCFTENHITPFNTVQQFQFCGFKKRK
jgi:SAM-dependent methyltransferase